MHLPNQMRRSNFERIWPLQPYVKYVLIWDQHFGGENPRAQGVQIECRIVHIPCIVLLCRGPQKSDFQPQRAKILEGIRLERHAGIDTRDIRERCLDEWIRV
jgi:hypothetical protein